MLSYNVVIWLWMRNWEGYRRKLAWPVQSNIPASVWRNLEKPQITAVMTTSLCIEIGLIWLWMMNWKWWGRKQYPFPLPFYAPWKFAARDMTYLIILSGLNVVTGHSDDGSYYTFRFRNVFSFIKNYIFLKIIVTVVFY